MAAAPFGLYPASAQLAAGGVVRPIGCYGAIRAPAAAARKRHRPAERKYFRAPGRKEKYARGLMADSVFKVIVRISWQFTFLNWAAYSD